MNKNWYVLAVHPRKEEYVEMQLRCSGRNAVYPRYKKLVRHARKTTTQPAPLFPGYVFVEIDIRSSNWRRVNWVPGSIGLIKFADRPSPLSTSFVDRFITNLNTDGFAAFGDQFEVGDQVQAVGGPFDRLIGEVIGMSDGDRVKILMDAINRKIEATLPVATVVAA